MISVVKGLLSDLPGALLKQLQGPQVREGVSLLCCGYGDYRLLVLTLFTVDVMTQLAAQPFVSDLSTCINPIKQFGDVTDDGQVCSVNYKQNKKVCTGGIWKCAVRGGRHTLVIWWVYDSMPVASTFSSASFCTVSTSPACQQACD